MSRAVAINGPNILDRIPDASQVDNPLHILLLEPTDHGDALLRKEIEQLSASGMLYQDDIGVELHYSLLELLIYGVLVADQILEPYLHSRFVQGVLNRN